MSHRKPIIPAEILLRAYASGMFPMGMPGRRVGWFSPDPRGILPLEDFHIPHGLKRTLRDNPFEIRVNHAFEQTVRGCSHREETWIDETILFSYLNLHHLGFAHSVEAWRENKLVGGLYGVALGGAFFGESMFHVETDASKVALVALVQRMRARAFLLLDIQWTTPHLEKFGAVSIPREDYLSRLAEAMERSTTFA